LCINQPDSIEKRSQIPKMSEIYNLAEEVSGWLGVAENDSTAAIEFVRRILNLADFDQLVRDRSTLEECAAFLALMKRPWFSRRWIVQEIALARNATLYCGRASVSWSQFAGAVSLFASKRHDIRKLFLSSASYHHDSDFVGEVEELGANRLVYAANNVFRKADDGEILEHLLSLEALISTLSVFSASDPRDTVYAILQLANDARPASEKARNMYQTDPRVDHTPIVTPSMQTTSPGQEFFAIPLPGGPLQQDPGFGASASAAPSETRTFVDREGEEQSSRVNLTVPDAVNPKHGRSLSLSFPKLAHRWMKSVSEKRIVPDYEIPIYDVCKNFLAFAIPRSQSLDILCRPWAPEVPDLPSWLPKTTGAAFVLDRTKVYRRVKADPLVGSPELGRRTYQACGKTKAAWRFSEEVRRSLFVRGFVVDTLDTIEPPARGGTIPHEWLRLVNWTDSEAPVPDRFWRTLVADRGPDGRKPVSPIYQLACQYMLAQSTEKEDIDTKELSNRPNCPSLAMEFLRRVLAVVCKRRLFQSDR
jgi:Heterokaryon incompatibility protein (HET)